MQEDHQSQQQKLLAEAYQAVAAEFLTDANRAPVGQAEMISGKENVYNARI